MEFWESYDTFVSLCNMNPIIKKKAKECILNINKKRIFQDD
jgi:hypothetical protein